MSNKKVTLSNGKEPNGAVFNGKFPGGCFAAGTLVSKADGTKVAIELLVAGDVLTAYSVPNRIDESDPTWINWSSTAINTGFYTTSTVLSLGQFTVAGHYVVNGALHVTGDHKMLAYRASTSAWGWIPTDLLTTGDFLYNESGSITVISTVAYVAGTFTCYNVDVEVVDTYLVEMGPVSVVAHNIQFKN